MTEELGGGGGHMVFSVSNKETGRISLFFSAERHHNDFKKIKLYLQVLRTTGMLVSSSLSRWLYLA